MEFFSIDSISKLLKFCLSATFIIGVFITVFLEYVLINWLSWYFIGNTEYLKLCLLILRPCGVFALFILWQLISIMNTINKHNPFIMKNAACLRNIALASFMITVLFCVFLSRQFTVLTAVVAYIFLIAGFCCLVFSKLFKKAVEYKNETDLTI